MFLTVPIMIEINMDKLVIRYRQRLTLSFLYVVINIFINEIFKVIFIYIYMEKRKNQ